MHRELNHPPLRDVKLASSAAWVLSGHSISLSWEVGGTDGPASKTVLAWVGETGLEVIEAVPEQGVRQIIFTRAGIYTFTLTVTFRDGVKLNKQIQIRVLS